MSSISATNVLATAVQPPSNHHWYAESKRNGLHQLFERQAVSTPDALAVVLIANEPHHAATRSEQPATLTYHELNARANQLAHYLQTVGVGTGAPPGTGAETLVGLCVERSVEMVIALLAILKAGGAYVPLDPTYPQERLAFMVEDANITVLLTQQHLQAQLPSTAARRVDLDRAWPQIAEQPATNPTNPVRSDQLAYVIYTSGSTGRPKGVLIEHGGLCNLATVQQQTFDLCAGHRVLQFASLNFDASIWEICMALCTGATLYVAPTSALLPGPPLTQLLVEHAITHITLVPSALATLDPADLPDLQTVIVAGEACPAPLARCWLPGRRFFNAYGPTETTVCATIMACTTATTFESAPPIGTPIANVQTYILDEQGNQLPDGREGELYIGGTTLARGYLNRPDLTAERFIDAPFGAGRLYRTGDLARRRPDGNIDFLGRIDHQVKIRGFRIELGEIEVLLAAAPQVQTAVVAARLTTGEQPQLVAYLVLADQAQVDPAAIRHALRQLLQRQLPAYMIPAAFVLLPALPLMPNGKVDRHALPAPDEHAFATAPFAAPQSATEAALATIWSELLGLPQIGRDTNFFASGGHSLLATGVMARVRASFGCELPIRALFDAPTLAALATVIDEQKAQPDHGLPPAITNSQRPAILPLSSAQQRLWFLDQLEGTNATYNIALPLRLHGPLAVAALQAALQAIVDRHEVLRTTFPADDGVPQQLIAATLPLALPVVGLDHEADPAHALQQGLQAAAAQPFALAAGPLVRTTLYRLHANEHVLLFVFHHIIVDGWSMGILLRELDTFYRAYRAGTAPQLPPLPLQYADYAHWQQRWRQGATLDWQRAYWQQQLAGVPTRLALPTDFPRPPVQRFQGEAVDFTLAADLTAALHRLSQAHAVTPFMVLYAAFAALLARHSGQTDLVIGTTVANRPQRELEPLIGFFVNTLPLRVDLGDEPTGAVLLARVRELTLAAYAHQELPFDQLVAELQVERNPGYAPLCQVMLTFDNTRSSAQRLADLAVVPVQLASRVAKFDLTLSLTEGSDIIQASLEYNRDLFTAATIARMAGHFQVLLAALVADATTPVTQLPLLTSAEQHQLLVEWNNTATDYPSDKTIHQLFAAQAARTPDAVAVVFAGADSPSTVHPSLTYAELDARANQLAHHLRSLGIRPGTLVGLCLERSSLLIVGILGILKAGCAYVPLDPAYPQERLALMVEDTATPLIITQATLQAQLPQTVPTCCVDTAWPVVATQPTTAIPCAETRDSAAESLAYVMYTSGSTGQPKGVCVTHRNVVRLVQQTNFVSLTAAEVFLQLAPIAFDAATFEIWGALLNGARLVVMAPGQPSLAAIGEAIRQHGVTTLWLTAGLFHLMVDEQLDALRPLRQLLAGGDLLSVPHVERVLRALPHCRLINGYGPTENTTFTCCYTFSPDLPLGASAPIGRPIANTQVYLLDQQLQPVPISVAGELYAGGGGVAQGYLNRPELTAARFIPNPFAQTRVNPSGEARGREQLYKTGDLARWLPDGNLEFLGRLDGQVKIRGFRIELGEIEATLVQHGAVREAVVLARHLGDALGREKQLVAYVVPVTAQVDNLPATLRQFLQHKLPDYMIPTSFLTLDRLPLTPTGKIDRQALPQPDDAPAPATTFAPPQTPTEARLATLWAQLLGVQQVGQTDNFFDLGGHSLLATQLVARVRTAFAVDIGVRALFETPTIAALGAIIDAQQRADQIALRPASRPTPLPLSFAQQRLWFLDQLEGANAIYNIPFPLRLHGPLDLHALHRALNAVIARHESLRTIFPAPNGMAQQLVVPRLDLALPLVDLQSTLAGCDPDEQAARLHAQLQAAIWQPFDLATGPLLRATLYRLDATDHLLAITFHHIIADGWSLEIFLHELAVYYGAESTKIARALPDLPLHYADYTCWQQAWLQGARLEQQRRYWRQQLANVPTLLPLPTDLPRPAVQRYQGSTLSQPLGPALTAALQQLSRAHGVTLFMTLYAAFATLLARYSDQEDLVIGTPIANRQQREWESLIGFFVNTLPLRADLTNNPSVAELLQRVRRLMLDAYTHQDLPFEQLVSELQVERSLSHAPLCQVMLAFNNTPLSSPPFGELTVTPLELESVVAKFDLTLQLSEVNGELQARWEYNRDLFTLATIERMAGHFNVLLAGMVADPTMPVQQLPLLTAAERQQLLVAWNQTARPYPQHQLIHQLVEAQALLTPHALAVTLATPPQPSPAWGGSNARPHETSVPPLAWGRLGGGATLTYEQLNAAANQLAHYLQTQGVGPGTLVGLCLERSTALLVGILGILKAGGAYVPLDAAYPQARLTMISTEAGLALIVTEQGLLDRCPTVAGTPICLDRDWATIGQLPIQNPIAVAQPTDLAYVIYTSGSTGRPKGVMVTHQNLVHSTVARFHEYTAPVGRFLLLSSFAFDSSVAGIFWSLCQGGALVLPPPEGEKDLGLLARLVSDNQITHLLALPSLYSLLLTYTDASQLSSLQVVIVAGEACPPTLPAQHYTALPAAALYNEYGPTEGTVWSTVYKVPQDWAGSQVPIGYPIANMQLYVLDRHRQPAPLGVPGELYIGGAGITPGYLKRPDLTAEKFVPHPFNPVQPSERLYRTGDLVRYLPAGALEFLGRIDHQVKLRGFRIELNEIATLLLQHSQVQDAVVIVHTAGEGQPRLVAYVTAKGETRDKEARDKETRDKEIRDLRAFLQSKLPDYMVPAAFVWLDALPLTPNGKVDRRALPAPDTRQSSLGRVYLAPRTVVERQVAAIWQQLFGVAQISVDDDFFALGGHSLLLAQLAAQLRATFQREISLRTLFQSPTLAAMSVAIAAAPRLAAVASPRGAQPSLPSSPYLHYASEPLDQAIKLGKLPPVAAAAFGYWPDELLHGYGAAPQAVIAQTFGGRPTVASILETAWGRIATILLPRLHAELYLDTTLVATIGDALALAGELGAKSVSLTGLLPSATDYGRKINQALGARTDLPQITTGHAMTATAVVLNVEQILHDAGRTLAQERVVCLGLGSIGLSSLRLLLQVAPHPQTIMLCDLAAKLDQLQAIGRELVEVYGFQGELQISPVQQALPPAVYTATLIIGATNVPDVLDVDRLLPGTLLVDDSGPHCFDPQRAIARFARQHDLLFTEGGAIQLPQPIHQTFYTPPQMETLFAASALDNPQIMMGCVLSSLLSSGAHALPPTIGAIAPDLALTYYQAVKPLGIHAAPLHCAGYHFTAAAIAQFRQGQALGGPSAHRPYP